jgi:hypothetical protein
MFAGTAKSNARDMSRKGRSVFQRRPELNPRIGRLAGISGSTVHSAIEKNWPEIRNWERRFHAD